MKQFPLRWTVTFRRPDDYNTSSTVAWIINVKLLPYPPTPGSLSYWFTNKRKKKEPVASEDTAPCQSSKTEE